jgi:hypothetical protein
MARLRYGAVDDAIIASARSGFFRRGAGPPEMMLGFLLTRDGVEVAVLGTHADFSGISAAIRFIQIAARGSSAFPRVRTVSSTNRSHGAWHSDGFDNIGMGASRPGRNRAELVPDATLKLRAHATIGTVDSPILSSSRKAVSFSSE